MTKLEQIDKEVYDIIQKEQKRQDETFELIASENFCSEATREAVGSILCNKYTEGKPHDRYYGGCQYYDELEELCAKRWLQVFGVSDTYHVNVQPHSGSQANYAAFAAVLKPGDTILSMDLNHGGHLTHGSSVNFSGKLYKMVFYSTDKDGYIGYEDLRRKIIEYRPHLVLAGASAYPRVIKFEKIKRYIDDAYQSYPSDRAKPFFMVDMAHIAGLVATGYHPSPFGYADIVTTTCHKTLRSTRGGLVFCRIGAAYDHNADKIRTLSAMVDSAVFPGSQGGSLMHIIAGKAVGALESMSDDYKVYIGNVVKNTKAMSEEFKKMGYDVVTGGTDNHLFLLDFSKLGITGKDVQDACDRHNITLNKNCVPNEKLSPKLTSGVRIGCAAETTRGRTKEDFIKVAHRIDEIIREEVIKK